MIGIYLSGTGNTKHCMEKLLSLLDSSAKAYPIENDGIAELIRQNDIILLGYPTQYSNAPIMVRDFIVKNSSVWQGKKVMCIATMGAFSGDGAGCCARLLKKYGAVILGGLHIKMPDSVCDVRLLKHSETENRQIISAADKKIEDIAAKINSGKYPKDGLGIIPHIIGLLGQRLWFYGKTKNYSDKLKISDECIGCGKCASLCPMKNIIIENGRAIGQNKCTMCYRCISSCPKKAITLIGDEVVVQYRFDDYV